jgi:hypothetical protein
VSGLQHVLGGDDQDGDNYESARPAAEAAASWGLGGGPGTFLGSVHASLFAFFFTSFGYGRDVTGVTHPRDVPTTTLYSVTHVTAGSVWSR